MTKRNKKKTNDKYDNLSVKDEMLINMASDCAIAKATSQQTFELVKELHEQGWERDDRIGVIEKTLVAIKSRNKTIVSILTGTVMAITFFWETLLDMGKALCGLGGK